ncbi:MAG: adenylate/guanylate cyclase domain-containing protein [Alphaproteobacteria bacterium]|nr:adenylate/guanylate cyclase domain-containing protein [Alphaproteobacteria bacterium]
MPGGPNNGDDSTIALREDRRLAAIAFVDIVGYSILMAEEEARTHKQWMALLNDVLRPLAQRHRGTIVKSTGDGVLVEFSSALHAVEWARAVQKSAALPAGDAQAGSIVLRIAIHLGDIIATRDDIYGDGVNLAARLQEHATPGGIILSEAVYDLVRGRIGAEARDLGYLDLKNFPKPVRAYALDEETQVASTPARPRQGALPSVAVLPLQNLGGNPDDNYFADGIVEDIIVSLAGLRELMVIARASTMMYRGREPDPRQVGRTLGVRYVLMGSVRRSTRLVRVSTQLCDAHSGANIWGDQTEVPLGELFEVQDRIVRRIVSGIAPHVRAAELEGALRKRPDSFTAYDYTLRALAIIHSLDSRTFRKAREYLERAMSEDRNFAMAAAWAARWYSLNIGQGWSENVEKDAAAAAELAARAIELDRQNALALATYGHLKSFLFHDCDSALVYFERALAACPNSSLAWILSSATLSYVGRGEQAVRHAEHGLWLSPFDQSLFNYYMFLGMAHYVNGTYEEAVKWGRMSASENPLYTSNLRLLVAALAALDRMDEAREVAQTLLRQEPTFTVADYEKTRAPFRDPEVRERVFAHLRKAGLPD